MSVGSGRTSKALEGRDADELGLRAGSASLGAAASVSASKDGITLLISDTEMPFPTKPTLPVLARAPDPFPADSSESKAAGVVAGAKDERRLSAEAMAK